MDILKHNVILHYFIMIEEKLGKAFYWYQKAAENGHVKAQYNLVLLYYKEKNSEKAFYWYQKVATNDFMKINEDDETSRKIMKLFKPITRLMIELEDEIYNRCHKCFKKRSLKQIIRFA